MIDKSKSQDETARGRRDVGCRMYGIRPETRSRGREARIVEDRDDVSPLLDDVVGAIMAESLGSYDSHGNH
jgi:hypothetical protein